MAAAVLCDFRFDTSCSRRVFLLVCFFGGVGERGFDSSVEKIEERECRLGFVFVGLSSEESSLDGWVSGRSFVVVGMFLLSNFYFCFCMFLFL